MSLELRIRLARGDDAAAFAAMYAPYVRETAISFEESPPTTDEMRDRVLRVLEHLPWLTAEYPSPRPNAAPEIAGFAYATPHRERAAYRWAVDTSVYVARERQRSGVGSALYRALFALLPAQRLQRAYAGIALPNAGSVGLHEACGFTPVGIYERVGYKFGAWHDVGWWARRLRDDAVPEEPIPLPQLAPHELAAILGR